MSLNIIRNDITKVKADVIVNTANPKPVIGGGTDSAIYEAAGSEKLLAAREKIGDIAVGEAYVTPAFDLPAKFIVHTVGPVWAGGTSGEREQLRSCYLNSLELASQYKCSSIAFPLISSGVYGFPKEVAVDVAKKAIREFLEDHEMEVYLVVFDEESLVASKEHFQSVKELVSSEYVKAREEAEYGLGLYGNSKGLRRAKEIELLYAEAAPSVDEAESVSRRQAIMEAKDIGELLGGKQIGFRDKYTEFLYGKKLDPSKVYTEYYGRKTHNKILNVEGYHPSKGTAIEACLGLHLSLSESYQLLMSAGYTFNENFDPDVVLMYCIINKKYHIRDINDELERNGLPVFDLIY